MKLQNLPISKEIMQNAILVEAHQYWAYKNGVKQDYLEGSRITIVLVNYTFEKITIKIPNIFIEDVDIKINKPIQFKNLELKLIPDYKNAGHGNIIGVAEGFSQ